MENRLRSQGFTLIELSIVLVIIGLIVGGILVGQNLISAAGMRATIAQIEKYDTAANTFRIKYGNLPGDIPDPAASSFGFQPRGTCSGATPCYGEGDGNGLIQGSCEVSACTAGNNVRVASSYIQVGETALFFQDLGAAGLIDGQFALATANNIAALPIKLNESSSPPLSAFFPAAKIGQGNYVYVWSGGFSLSDGNNYLAVAGVNYIPSNGSNQFAAKLTPSQAYNMDQKIDDGFPTTGSVQAMWAGGFILLNQNFLAVDSPLSCYTGGKLAVSPINQQYNLLLGPNNLNCALSFKMQ